MKKYLLSKYVRCRYWKNRMLKQDEMIKRLIDLESDICYQEYAGTDDPEFLHEAGILPILISAPHGAAHTREGSKKEEDEYTAGIARFICAITGAHVIYARRRSRTDPNADPSAPYKRALRQIVHENEINFVLDLHGAKKDQKFGIALGTMHSKSCPKKEKLIIVETFEKYGISTSGNNLSCLDIDDMFPGEGSDDRVTIIKFCHQNSIPSAQVEVNAWLRIPIRRADATAADKSFQGNQRLIVNLINALSDLVVSLANP